MCAVPAPGSDAAAPRNRISPLQWVGLALLALLLAYQMGLFGRGGALGLGAETIPFLIAIVLAVTVHEFSHALVATLFGDDLPRRMGRLTLNPLAHLDPMGSLLFLIARFGWGKPVPINPAAMRYPNLGWALSSAAGPVSNLLVAALALVLFALMGPARLDPLVRSFVDTFILVNVSLAVFNLIPLPPLDGFGFVFGLAPRPLKIALLPVQQFGPWILLGLLFLPRLIPGFPSVISGIMDVGMDYVLDALTRLYRAF